MRIGGLPTRHLSFCQGGWFCQVFEPLALLDAVEARLADDDCTDEDRTVLERLVDTIDNNGNNMLFIGKLKEEFHHGPALHFKGSGSTGFTCAPIRLGVKSKYAEYV